MTDDILVVMGKCECVLFVVDVMCLGRLMFRSVSCVGDVREKGCVL